MTGTSLSHYRIAEKLGEGGMGVVYKAFDTRLLRPVAIKILPPQLVADERNLLCFTQEAQTASALNHPNICTIHDIDEQDGIHFIVMELVEGETLRQMLERRGPLPEPEVIAIAMKVADALKAAHAKGIIHRDLKPENIMISREGYIKVMDFGLAKLLERKSEFAAQHTPWRAMGASSEILNSSAGVLQGTASYMAPEQIEMMPVDARADIFSLGVLLFELLAGRPPFVGATLTEVLQAIIATEANNLEEVNPVCSLQMANLVKRALAKRPEHRCQTAQEVLDEIQKLQKHAFASNLSVERSVVPSRLRLLRRRKLSLALVVIAALFVIYQFFHRQATRTLVDTPLTTVAVLEFVNVGGNPDDQYLARGIWEDLLLKWAKLPALLAIPATTIGTSDTINLRELGDKYKADYVLQGRVEHRDDGLHVRCDLIKVSENKIAWAQNFKQSVADIFALQQKLAEQIAVAMNIELPIQSRGEFAARYTSSLAAYEYYLRGREYFSRHYEANYNFAIALYKKALLIDPNFALAYAGLGEAYLSLFDWYMKREAGLVDTAEICIKKALAIDPNLPEAHVAFGDLCRLRGADQVPQALAEYLTAIRLNPRHARALFQLTRLHREAGNFKEAAIWGKKCLQLQPTNAEACVEMAFVCWFQGFHNEATQYYDRALEMEPDHPISYGQKAFFAFCNGQWDLAKSLYERNLELDPRSSQARGALARIAFSEGQVDKAIVLYKQLMQMGADGMDYFNLGQIYLLKGNFAAAHTCRDSALAVSQRLLKKNPEDHRWLSDLAIAYAVKGDTTMALEYIRQAKQTRDFQANFIRRNRVLLREAMVFSLLGKNDEALASLQQLLSLRMYAPEYFRRYIGLEKVRRDPRFAQLMESQRYQIRGNEYGYD